MGSRMGQFGVTQNGVRFEFTVDNNGDRTIILRHNGFQGSENDLPEAAPSDPVAAPHVRISATGELAIDLNQIPEKKRVLVMAIDSNSHDVIVDSNC